MADTVITDNVFKGIRYVAENVLLKAFIWNSTNAILITICVTDALAPALDKVLLPVTHDWLLDVRRRTKAKLLSLIIQSKEYNV